MTDSQKIRGLIILRCRRPNNRVELLRPYFFRVPIQNEALRLKSRAMQRVDVAVDQMRNIRWSNMAHI